MGISPSKKVRQTLLTSPDFTTACTTTFTTTLSLTQHSTPLIYPYQLHSASLSLHHSLSATCPLIQRWAPSPPSRLHVDRAYKSLNSRDPTLDFDQFKEFAVALFTGEVVDGVGRAVGRWVPVGVAGIGGVGVVGRVGREVVAGAVGVYALGVVTSVYLSLG